MTKDESREILDDLEPEIAERLPEGVGFVLFICDHKTGETAYTSNMKRETSMVLMKSFVNRNTQ